MNRRGGTVILHHRHIRPVLIRDWSRPMDGITATIWASRRTSHPSRTELRDRDLLAQSRQAVRCAVPVTGNHQSSSTTEQSSPNMQS